MAAKMAAACGQFALVDTLSNLSSVAAKFHIWITLIMSSPKFEHRFCPIAKTVAVLVAPYGFALVNIRT